MPFVDLIATLLPDLILGAVMIVMLIYGAKVGMFRSFSGLLTILVAVFGAKLLADWGSVLVAEYIVPLVQPAVEHKLAEILAEQAVGAEGVNLGVLGMVPGVPELVEGITDSVATSIAPAVALEVAKAIGWVILFVLGAVLFRVVCYLVVELLDVIDCIPGLHFLNHLLGGVFGLLKGFLLVLLVVIVVVKFGWLPESMLEDTVLMKWMAQITGVY